jgi:hypothetical protein
MNRMSKHYLFQLYSYRLVSGLHDRVDVYELDILPKLDRMRIGDGNVKKNFHVGFLYGGCLLFRRHVAAKAQVTKPTAFTIRYTEKDVPASGMKPPATELHFGKSYLFVRVDGAVADLKIIRASGRKRLLAPEHSRSGKRAADSVGSGHRIEDQLRFNGARYS